MKFITNITGNSVQQPQLHPETSDETADNVVLGNEVPQGSLLIDPYGIQVH